MSALLAEGEQPLTEPAWVVPLVAERTGASEGRVSQLIDAAHHVVDKFVTDDVAVLAPPLVIAFGDDPVFQRLRSLVKEDGFVLGSNGLESPQEEVASSLRLPLELVGKHPFVGHVGVVLEVVGLVGASPHEWHAAESVLDAWFELHDVRDSRPLTYLVRPVGKESVFESWLEADLSRLARFGYDVRLAAEPSDGLRGRQPHLDRRSISDLVCRFTEDCDRGRAGDWLVIENKATAVGPYPTSTAEFASRTF